MNETDEQTVADAPKKPSPLKSPRVRIVLLLVVIAAVVLGVLWYLRNQSYGKYQQSTNDAYIQSDAVIVSSKLGGYVEQVYVSENQWVKAGQPLVRIDSREFNAQAEQAQAQIGLGVELA